MTAAHSAKRDTEISAYVRQGLRTGAVVSGAVLFLTLTGLLQAFADRDLIGRFSLSNALMLIFGLLPGLAANRRTSKKQDVPARSVIASAVAGLVLGVVMTVLTVIAETVDLRNVLVNVTPDLVDVLRGGAGIPIGVTIVRLAGGCLILSLLGGLFNLLPARARSPLYTGLGAVFLVAMFVPKGLSPLPAAVIFVGVGALAAGWRTFRPRMAASRAGLSRSQNRTVNLVLAALLLLALIYIPIPAGDYWTRILGFVGLYALVGLGLNIVVGFAGLLDLGYVAFFAIGAYTMALLTSPASSLGTNYSFWVIWPVAFLMSCLAGILLGIPVLRLRGDYLAIVTLGFGEIIRILATSDMLKPYIGGPQGILETPSPVFAGLTFVKPMHFYYLILLGCILVAFVSYRLSYSRIGRAWIAIREDEDVAQAMGINLIRYKLLAFATGAAFAGIGGAIFASWQHAIFPADFTLFVSINVLCLIIIGGIGSIPGVILGAAVLVGLPEVLREIQDYRLLAYGALLVFMMIARPEGLLPSQRRRLEMHKDEEIDEAEPAEASSPARARSSA